MPAISVGGKWVKSKPKFLEASGRDGLYDRRPVGGLAGRTGDRLGRVSAGKVNEQQVIVIEVRSGNPLHVLITVTFPLYKIL